ncbi:hypothetical protein ABL78_0195 [Leptomonas seymouri]|uniref:CS domain-containing protein n=1 Tax=Leptomonas seymouri TaxID=5684 RepID=A0A0N0P969_LEPSE|nr:hypothetical protein ABL78_0195 [Leptomonas seymouri]|eukprot:KPI90759.1 hypothetical protein ABL78_0195 [Leptomonas seymouri]
MSHLPIKWAERHDRLFITVEASNSTDVQVNFTEKSVTISGKGITAKSTEPRELKDELQLLKEIVPADSTFKVLGVGIQICAIKKEEGYWNRLVDEPTKATKGWLSVDWNLWKDEDDEADNAAAANFGGYGDMGGMDMGGMGGMGMGGMGGMGGMDMASMMSALGGAGGAGGMGGDSDDEEPLEEDEHGERPEEEEEGDKPAADLSDLNA